MISYLGFYDMAPVRAANDLFWSEIRNNLGHGPERLVRPDDPWPIWQDPDLLLAQTCSLPFRTRLHGQVTLVGTPDYGLPGCPPGHYRSAMVVRRSDRLRNGARMAINDAMSQSGWAGPMAYLIEQGIAPGEVVETGAHALSLQALADGHADMAGVDLLSWIMLDELGLLPSGLEIVDMTEPTLGTPYISAAGRDPAPIANAISAAIDALPAPVRAALHLHGLVQHGAPAYLAEPLPNAAASNVA